MRCEGSRRWAGHESINVCKAPITSAVRENNSGNVDLLSPVCIKRLELSEKISGVVEVIKKMGIIKS